MKKQVTNTKRQNLHNGHRIRVKDNYKKFGIDCFHPHEILELLLFFGVPYKDTNEISHELIDKFGTFSAVFDADLDSLESVKNMTENAALLIKLVSDISKICNTGKQTLTEKFDTFEKICSFLLKKYSLQKEEKVFLLLFDNSSHMVGCIHINEGGKSVSEINIGKIVKIANTRNVRRVAIAHNHPDNSPISTNDIVTTKKLSYHLDSVDIDLLESYVITRGKVFGILNMINKKA